MKKRISIYIDEGIWEIAKSHARDLSVEVKAGISGSEVVEDAIKAFCGVEKVPPVKKDEFKTDVFRNYLGRNVLRIHKHISGVDWSLIVEIDEKEGEALIRSTTPFDKNLERGVIIGGMSAPGDLVFINVENDDDECIFKIEFH